MLIFKTWLNIYLLWKDVGLLSLLGSNCIWMIAIKTFSKLGSNTNACLFTFPVNFLKPWGVLAFLHSQFPRLEVSVFNEQVFGSIPETRPVPDSILREIHALFDDIK